MKLKNAHTHHNTHTYTYTPFNFLDAVIHSPNSCPESNYHSVFGYELLSQVCYLSLVGGGCDCRAFESRVLLFHLGFMLVFVVYVRECIDCVKYKHSYIHIYTHTPVL
jgi:hypothetical protein